MSVEFSIISIGALSRNPFWDEIDSLRTPHSTTTLIVSGEKKILVDPGLPFDVLDARLFERSGLRGSDITAVFLTTFRSAHRGGLVGFKQATWLIGEAEKHHARSVLEELYSRSKKESPEDRRRILDDIEILERCKSAPEDLADQVSLFPSAGASVGSCGLLLTPPIGSIVVTGDAVINSDYLQSGRVWDDSFDIQRAQESLEDILEVADIIVPGHDNMIPLLGKML
jgi:glyoxylase-like metal-dependent hydrolase (beta-lactamase superfamily II)